MTWYPESFTKVPMNDMNMRADPSRGYPGRTYRFYTGEVVYGFGYGLSYSNYAYKFVSAPDKISLFSSSSQDHISRDPPYASKDGLDYVHVDKISSCEELKFYTRISVVNNGGMDGSHVVLLFSKSIIKIKGSPMKQLVGFERVNTEAKRSTEIDILVDPCKHLSTVNEKGERILLLGAHVLMLDELEHILYVEI